MKKLILFFLFVSFLATSCKEKMPEINIANQEKSVLTAAPEWSKNANIYEVNIRQYTEEGSFNAFAAHLPRLKELGVDILWLMPIHPISKKNRKGSLGSYYAVQNYKGVNPDFGTDTDFKSLVSKVHQLDMKIILDWVPNHTGFDNNWISEHPDWYTKDKNGEVTHPIGTDWTDVADLNYDNEEMRAAMTDAMSYWITDFDIDGFRCDVAGEVPNDFWEANNANLFGLKKDIFMLAEWDEPSLHDAGFHMSYGWGFHHVLNQLAKNEVTLTYLDSFVLANKVRFGPEAYKMNFITNHDENSWNGTIQERMGSAADALAVLAFTIDGMPLIYSGQEAGLNWRLKFFEKDQVNWENLEKSDFYAKLLDLKHRNPAIWNGTYGGDYHRIQTSNDENIFCFARTKGENEIIVALNLSGDDQIFTVRSTIRDDNYQNVFEETDMVNPVQWKEKNVEMAAWSYLLFERKSQ